MSEAAAEIGTPPATHRDSLRWAACLALVAAAHAAAFAILSAHHVPVQAATPPPAAVMIDLAPLPAPPAPPVPTPPVPTPPQPPPVAPPQPAPPPLPVPIPTPPKLDLPPPEVAQPITPPPPPRPHPHPHRKPVALPPSHPVAVPVPAVAAPPPPPQSRPAPPAPTPLVAPPVNPDAVPDWRGAIVARLEAAKQYPHLAREHRQQGVATLRFTMDRAGKVLSAALVASSGYDLLDDEALALLQRAQPLPAPPPEVTGDVIELTVPVSFRLTGE